MKPYTSILGGGIASALLKGLEGKELRHVARYDSNGANLQFSLRRSYRHERGMWGGLSYHTRTVATGGMILQCWGESLKETSLPPFRRSYRIKPSQTKRAQWFLGAAITRMARQWGAERIRQRYVQMVDSAAKPFIKSGAFLSAVTKQESKWGESDYGKLTAEQCQQWLEWIAAWKKAH